MDIKFFDGDKELIYPDFKLLIERNKNIIVLAIKNLSPNEQEHILFQLINLSVKQIELNENSIYLKINKHYFFDITSYKNLMLHHNFTQGNLDLMFAFYNENNVIIDRHYPIFKLHEFKIN